MKSDSNLRESYGRSSMAWRRQRLINIGATQPTANPRSESTSTESSSLSISPPNVSTYGTLPLGSPRSRRARVGVGLPSLPPLSGLPFREGSQEGPLWSPPYNKTGFRRTRTASTYDPPLGSANKANRSGYLQGRLSETKLNGIRVWYSSFTSVDWLHDAIKESSRLWRIRTRKSFKGKTFSAIDRSVDWITVTIVGFLTAIVAFLIVRSEQWLFDLKEGYCPDGFWRARRFCVHWKTWGDLFGNDLDRNGVASMAWFAEYAIYAAIAVSESAPTCYKSLTDALFVVKPRSYFLPINHLFDRVPVLFERQGFGSFGA